MNLVNIAYLVVVLLLACGVGYMGFKVKKVVGVVAFTAILGMGYVMHVSYFENMFAKRFGGVLNVETPENMLFITASWKDDQLWILNYDPKTDKCIYREKSKVGALEGEVRISNCNPLIYYALKGSDPQ